MKLACCCISVLSTPKHEAGVGVQASVAYYLMSDNRRRMPSSAYLRAEMTEASDVTSSRHSGKEAPCCCPAAV